MKKLAFFVATICLVVAANAQSLKLQSAISDLKNKRLDRAKENIDAASVHESTKNDAKTWHYKGEIYFELATTTNEKYKTLAENPLQTALDATLKSIELDKENEFKDQNSVTMQRVGIAIFNTGLTKLQAGSYKESMDLFEKSVQINLTAGNATNASNSRFYAGISAEYLRDTTAVIKNYQALVNSGFKDIYPYSTLYNIYKAEKDTIKAKRVAERLVKVMDTNYKAHIIMADAYALVGDNKNFKETLQKVLTMKPNDTVVLNAIGGAYEQNKEYDIAVEKYNQSLQINPNQYAANYQMGVMYYNQGVDKFNQANDVPEDDNTGLYDKYNNEGKEIFKKAIPYLEKANTANLKDENTIRALLNIHARLGNTEMIKKMTDQLEKLKQK